MSLRKIKLTSGDFIPEIGYGTYLEEDDECYQSVLSALKAGYRHIDTAEFYGNEEEVGKAIKDSGVPRKEIFVTTKIWNTHRGYDKAKKAFKESLEKLDLEYVDLLLIHWPANEKQYGDEADDINYDTWRALEDIYREGKAKSIGVSNFLKHHISSLVRKTKLIPMVDQIELHPGHVDVTLLNYLNNKGIVAEAWSPLGRGKLLNNELILELANKYKKTPAQILIRFIIDLGAVPLVKSISEDRIKENLDYNDFELSEEDMEKLINLDTGKQYKNPDEIDF